MRSTPTALTQSLSARIQVKTYSFNRITAFRQSWTSVVSRSKNSKLESMKRLNRSNEYAMQLREKTVEQSISSGELKVDGRKEAFTEFLGLLDTFPFWFNIVTP